ncbi:MAG: transposase [Candidatus Korobacteraceae bacterium]
MALSLLAYNLGNLWRRLALPKRIENWSLTSLKQRLVKTGGRLVKHARYYWLLLAEGGGSGRCWARSRYCRYRRDIKSHSTSSNSNPTSTPSECASASFCLHVRRNAIKAASIGTWA